MAVVARGLLDHVDQDVAQAGEGATSVTDTPARALRVAMSQCLGEQVTGASHGIPPECIQLLRSVVGGRAPIPVVVGGPVNGVPRGSLRSPVQPLGGHVVLEAGQMLEHPGQRQRRRADGCPQAGRIQSAALPGERRALAFEEAQERGELVACSGGVRRTLLMPVPPLLVQVRQGY
jgi:hypothetical protein